MSRGRRPDTGEARSARLYVRVSPSELEQIQDSVPAGSSVSNWIRSMIFIGVKAAGK